MKPKWLRALLLFSLMLNVAFISLAFLRMRDASTNDRNVEVTRRGRLTERWPHRRAANLTRALDLEPGQKAALREQLEPLRARLFETRRDLDEARGQFRQALAQRDAEAVRTRRQQVSTIQAHFDSLTAEAMLRELEVLNPSQRERYLHRTFRAERGRRHRQHVPGGPGLMLHGRHSIPEQLFQPKRPNVFSQPTLPVREGRATSAVLDRESSRQRPRQLSENVFGEPVREFSPLGCFDTVAPPVQKRIAEKGSSS